MRYLLSLISIGYLFSTTGCSNHPHPTAEGITTGLEKGVAYTVVLEKYYGRDFVGVDSVVIQDSVRFQLQDKVSYGGVYRLSVNHGKAAELVLTSTAIVRFTADANIFKYGEIQLEDDPENWAYHGFVTITENDKLNQKFLKLQAASQDSFLIQLKRTHSFVNHEFKTITDSLPHSFTARVLIPIYKYPEGSASDNSEYLSFVKAHYFDSIPFSDRRILYTSAFKNKITTYLREYTDMSLSGMQKSLDELMTRSKANAEVHKFLYNHLLLLFLQNDMPVAAQYLMETYDADGSLQHLPEQINGLAAMARRLSNGKAAPELNIPDAYGKDISLLQTAAASKLTILYFWQSGCENCEAEHPAIKALYDQYHANGLNVYGVSLDTDKAEWLKTISSQKMDWITVAELKPKGEAVAPEAYNITATPALFLIDANGALAGRDVFGDELKAKVKEVMEK